MEKSYSWNQSFSWPVDLQNPNINTDRGLFFTAFFPHICYPIYICIAGPAGGSVTWPPSGTTYIIALLASSTARVTSTSKVFCRHRSDTRYVEMGSLSHLELSWETWLLVHVGPITKSQEEGEMNLYCVKFVKIKCFFFFYRLELWLLLHIEEIEIMSVWAKTKMVNQTNVEKELR